MHELGIVFHVIKTVERVGAENDLTRVAGVTLELGEVCGAIPRELISCWDWAVQKSDLLRGAQLHIDTRRDTLRRLRRGLPHCGPRAGLPPLRQRGYLAAAGQRDQH
mgnify:CR=1 FL=1